MKFAFISTMDGSPWGGSEELWSQAAPRLKRAGHDVQASVHYWPQLSEKVTALAEQGIPIETHCEEQLRPAAPGGFWKNLGRGSNYSSYDWLKKFNPDLAIISQGYNAGGFGWAKACRESGIPYVLVVHCNSELWWFRDQLEEAVASYTAARAVFCVSRKNLQLLRMQLGDPLPNAEVIWSPTNVSAEAPPAWPTENAVWRLACVARLDVVAKGQDLLLQTLARPEWRTLPVELNLYGTGRDETLLRRMADLLQLKNIHFRGHVGDIRSVWAENHLMVLPSRYEGLPLTLIEAMWCGRPSVVTDIGGSAELCVDNETGFVAAAPTVDLFAAALQRAWDRRGDWQHIGHAARALVEQRIPKDPVAVFCARLQSSVAASAETQPAKLAAR
jgi:glycosyltransferase involved in cell wall biosynthesis